MSASSWAMSTQYDSGTMNPEPTQLASAIAAVASAPATEYCLLWHQAWWACMTKAEWSGWMQAIGAFVAVMIAVAVPAYQHRVGRKRDEAVIKAKATVAAAGVLIAVREIRLWAFRMQNPGVLGKTECTQHLAFLRRVPRPTELELSALAAWDPACAVELSRALGHLNRCQIALTELIELSDGDTPGLWAALATIRNAARRSYEHVQAGRLKLRPLVVRTDEEATDVNRE